MAARRTTGLALFVGVSAIVVAQAATLGALQSSTLVSVNQSGSAGTPTVLTCDNFALAAATGSALDGRPVQQPANCGTGVWTVHHGTWTISGGELDPKGGDATSTISAGQTNISAQATVLNANKNKRVAGVAINHSGGSRVYLAAVLDGPGSTALLLVNGGSVSTLATGSATINNPSVIRITRIGTAITVAVDGALSISYTLSTGQVSTLSGGTRVGLYLSTGIPIRFTEILATTPVSP